MRRRNPAEPSTATPSALSPGAEPAVRWWTRVAVAAIRFYQHARAGRPSPCRYDPSCSTYAAESLQVHGVVRGSWLAVRRLSRCQPWGGQGYDPVPAPARQEQPPAPLPREEKVR